MADAAESPAISSVRSHLDDQMRVTLTDGRVLIGRFECFDKQRNVLLRDAQEQRFNGGETVPEPPRAPDFERHLGLVLVPRKHITAVHALEASAAR